MKYTVKRDVPDTLELLAVVSSARYTAELVSRNFSDEISTLPEVLDAADRHARHRLQALGESLTTLIIALERIEEMTDALDGIACRDRHLAAVKEAIFTPAADRNAAQKSIIYANCIAERDGETPQQTFDRYARECDREGFSPVELW